MTTQKIIFLTAIFISMATSQNFGKNKVQYEQFKWNFIQTQHFDIYFYGEKRVLSEFAAEAAENAYVQISKAIKFKLKHRLSLIIYNSHNDFQQTNISLSYMEEGIGGFTEFYKNRIVLPFEGSYSQFRHVIHHELVHALLNEFMYGGTLQSAVANKILFNLPLWMSEGLAEYLSIGWDTYTDLIIRDMAGNATLPEIQNLHGYFAYKGGQSVWRFIADRYGKEKISEIIHAIRRNRGVKKGFSHVLGYDLENLTDEWHVFLKNNHWQDQINSQRISQVGVTLTNHEKGENFYNIAPAISPDGSQVVFFSDQKGHADMFLYSLEEGKIVRRLIRGGRTAQLEELKWLTPGISWSPDGKLICFAAKSGSQDAIIIKEVESGKTQRQKLNLDGIFSTSWSPVGNKIAVVGVLEGQSDIFVWDITNKTLENVTNDVAGDFEPSWSADGQIIYFVSETRDEDLSEITFSRNIYSVDLELYKKRLVLDLEGNESHPLCSQDSKTLIFTSDKKGISNLYCLNLITQEIEIKTNLSGGVFQPSWSRDNSQLVFTTFKNRGWDIVKITEPLMLIEQKEGKATTFVNEEKKEKTHNYKKFLTISQNSDIEENSYNNFVFGIKNDNKSSSGQVVDSVSRFDKEGNRIVSSYHAKFTLDFVDAYASYGPRFGLQGTNIFALSDIMGNHRIYFGAELFVNLKNSDYSFSYMNLTNRINFGIGFWHSAHFYIAQPLEDLVRYRNIGLEALGTLPFTKFQRFEFGFNRANVLKDLIYYDYEEDLQREMPMENFGANIIRCSYILDTVTWGYTAPRDGRRAEITILRSPSANTKDLDFSTVKIDFRQYFLFTREFSAAFRFSAAHSSGQNAQRFFLGGTQNWINYKFASTPDYSDATELYFSEIVTPLRGSNYYTQSGNHYFLFNSEFRFPFVHFLYLGFPAKILFQNIRGALFADIGSAGELNNLKLDSLFGQTKNNILQGYGLGVRIFFGYFLLKIDTAWTHENANWSRPKYYFSVGADF